MSTEYEEEIYNYFIEPSNFETMLKVANHSETVCTRLVQEFWTELKGKLEQTVKGVEGDWRVKFSDKWNYRWNRLWIYKEEWCVEGSLPIISVAFEDLQPKRSPYIGVHIRYDNKNFDVRGMKKAIIELEGAKEYDTDSNNYWAIWKHLSFKLTGFDSLVQLLHENRKETQRILIKDVQDLMELVSDKVPEILSNNRMK